MSIVLPRKISSIELQRNLPSVACKDPRVESVFVEAFRKICEVVDSRELSPIPLGCLCSSVFLATMKDLAPIVKDNRDIEVTIEYEGERIGFITTCSIPYCTIVNTTWTSKNPLEAGNCMLFPCTNEPYGTQVTAAIGKAQGVTHYLGIAGGLDAALTQLGIISSKGPLSSVTLVDNQRYQLLYDVFKLFEYDIIPQDTHPASVDYRFRAMRSIRNYPAGLPKIPLLLSDIQCEIKFAQEPGVYFIYLSNAFLMPLFTRSWGDLEQWDRRMPYMHINGWSTEIETRAMLRSAIANPNIHEGSYMMFASPGPPGKFMIIRKQGNTFVTESVSLGEDLNAELSDPDDVINTKAQHSFFFNKDVE